MKEEYKDDTFLARWLNNELTEEELTNFKASEDYPVYQKLVAGADTILAASFEQETLLNKIKAQRAGGHQLGQSRRMAWRYAVAATVVFLLGFALFTILSPPGETMVLSDIGEKKTVVLPDGSEVLLNANSSISYLEGNWDDNRIVSLTGEAYFKVKKGSDFSVKSATGLVTVLGTEFNVQDIRGFYEVSCFEGSVQVVSDQETETLKPKHAVRRARGQRFVRRDISGNAPSWKENKSTFSQVPMKSVLIELQNQYGITFRGSEKLENMTYTGTFPHDNLTLSLKLVLGSLQIDYQIGENSVVTLEN